MGIFGKKDIIAHIANQFSGDHHFIFIRDVMINACHPTGDKVIAAQTSNLATRISWNPATWAAVNTNIILIYFSAAPKVGFHVLDGNNIQCDCQNLRKIQSNKGGFYLVSGMILWSGSGQLD